jgi:hypothetical protein
MNCSIVIPSEAISIQTNTAPRPSKQIEEDEFPIWRSAVYEFWTESDIYTDIILQLDLLHTEYIFASYTLQKIDMSWTQFQEKKQSVLEGVYLLNKKGYFDRKKHHLTTISFYFYKLAYMSKNNFRDF